MSIPLCLPTCPTVVMSMHRCPGHGSASESVCGTTVRYPLALDLSQKAETRFLSPYEWQNPRPFTPIGLSQELEGHAQVSPRILPAYPLQQVMPSTAPGSCEECKLLCKWLSRSVKSFLFFLPQLQRFPKETTGFDLGGIRTMLFKLVATFKAAKFKPY